MVVRPNAKAAKTLTPQCDLSPIWNLCIAGISSQAVDADIRRRTICETHPGFRGALLITSNEYNTANQLIATREYADRDSK